MSFRSSRSSRDSPSACKHRAGSEMSDRIRVLHCIDNMRIGGTELNAVRTAERLDASRFEVSALCLSANGPLSARYAAAGIPVFSFPIPNLFGPRAIRRGVQLARFL